MSRCVSCDKMIGAGEHSLDGDYCGVCSSVIVDAIKDTKKEDTQDGEKK